MARLTPAYAGKTSARASRAGCCAAHPRVCGEDTVVAVPEKPTAGSPPRMRGRPVGARRAGRDLRLTPAYAGKTYVGVRYSSCNSAHPRVCGEDAATMKRMPLRGGSPPRMRGRPPSNGPNGPQWRLTPAYAGKTSSTAATGRKPRAHPRVCGEDGTVTALFYRPRG